MSLDDSGVTDVDVLCGRGNKINYKPGNIRFRKLINAYRNDYANAPRHSKVLVAKRVIQSIHNLGGRFLGMDPKTNRWVEVDIRKATEKACQALREDVQAKRNSSSGKSATSTVASIESTQSQQVNNKKKIAPVVSHLEAQISGISISEQRLKTKSPKNVEFKKVDSVDAASNESFDSPTIKKKASYIVEDNYEDDKGFAAHDRIEIEQLTGDTTRNKDINENLKYLFQPYSIGRQNTSNKPSPGKLYRGKETTEKEWNAMYNRLRQYRDVFGHTAVPLNWAGNQELANWVRRQRQLYRDTILTSHRAASKIEQDFIQRLNDINFVWDYDEWCWNQNHISIQQIASGTGNIKSGATLQTVKKWLSDQQELATRGELSDDQVTKLNDLLASFNNTITSTAEESDEDKYIFI